APASARSAVTVTNGFKTGCTSSICRSVASMSATGEASFDARRRRNSTAVMYANSFGIGFLDPSAEGTTPLALAALLDINRERRQRVPANRFRFQCAAGAR